MQVEKLFRRVACLLILCAVWLSSPRSTLPQTASPAQRLLKPSEAPLKALPGKSDRFALVIGIDSYQDEQISELRGAANDAKALADALIRCAGFPADQVILLTSDQSLERQPTRASILRRLANLRRAVPKDGLLLVYFAGHGMERKTSHGQQAFLLPMDAQVSGDISLVEDTALTVESMRDRIRDTGVEQVIVIVDACRNDPVKGRSVGVKAAMSAAFKKFDFSRNQGIKAFATLYATQVGSVAYEYREKLQGYFTWALVEGLTGKAAGSTGEVTLSGLTRYVESTVPRLTALKGLSQQPFSVIEGYQANELILSFSGEAIPTADAVAQTHDLCNRKMTVAVGVAVAIMGQSSQQVGAQVFERALIELGMTRDDVRALSQRYASLENRLRSPGRQAQPANSDLLSQTDFLAILRDHIREHSGDQFPAYVDLGYDLGHLLILLQFWERLPETASLVSRAAERLASLQKNLRRVIIPAALIEGIGSISADKLTDKFYREAARQVLDAALGHYDQ